MMSRLKPADAATLVAILVFALLAVALHDSIAGLGDMGRGISDTGRSIQSSGRATATEIRASAGGVADALDALPLVGGEAGRAVRDTATRTAQAVEAQTRTDGRRLVLAGEQGERDARSTAALVGWLAFLVPTVLLVAIRLGTSRWAMSSGRSTRLEAHEPDTTNHRRRPDAGAGQALRQPGRAD